MEHGTLDQRISAGSSEGTGVMMMDCPTLEMVNGENSSECS